MHNSHTCSYCRSLGSYMTVQLYVCSAGVQHRGRRPYPQDEGVMLYVAREDGRELVADEPYIIDENSSPIGLVEAKQRAMDQGWIARDQAASRYGEEVVDVGDALARLKGKNQ